MDRIDSGDSQDAIGSVQQAVNFYGRRKVQMPFSDQKPPSRARDLHLAKKDINQYNDNRRAAEYMRLQAESELLHAKKTVKDFSHQIEETQIKLSSRKLEIETYKRPEIRQEQTLVMTDGGNHQYVEVMKELEALKRDLSKLKLDMAYLLETRTQADKQTEASTSRMQSYSSSIEGLQQAVEEANEEHVLVELARMEAVRELGTIEAQREAEANAFALTLENTRKKINEVALEIDHSKELEEQLAVTTSDVDFLQNELKLVKTMGESFKRNEALEQTGEETSEIEKAKKELANIEEEGFQFMASMDIIRNELKHVSEENSRLRDLERKSESTVQNLNFKLLRAKSKLESVTSAENKAKALVSNLSAALEQLTAEEEAAKKEKEIITETAAKIRAETEKIESEIDLAEERLCVTAKELEDAKATEAISLESLKNVSEKTMMDRVYASQHNSTITISSFEYKYLSGRAVEVEEIADKKVAAAQAWIEAVKASEKEILMKTEIALREMRELKMANEQEHLYKQEGEPAKLRPQQRERPRKSMKLQMKLDEALPKKFIKEYGNSTPVRRGTPRRPNSPVVRHVSRSGSISLKKKMKVMPNLVKFFGSKEASKNV